MNNETTNSITAAQETELGQAQVQAPAPGPEQGLVQEQAQGLERARGQARELALALVQGREPGPGLELVPAPERVQVLAQGPAIGHPASLYASYQKSSSHAVVETPAPQPVDQASYVPVPMTSTAPICPAKDVSAPPRPAALPTSTAATTMVELTSTAQALAASAPDPQREAARCAECPNRFKGTCADFNMRMGWNHGVPIDDCDACWSLGGPTTEAAAEWRASRAADWITTFKQRKKLITLPAEAAQAIVDKHLTQLEREEYARDPEFGLALTRTVRWNDVRSKWEMATSFARSMASKGFTGKKVELSIKGVRHTSCFGTDLNGFQVYAPCRSLALSVDGKHRFCNDCGCGDREIAHLDHEGYSKLDYPDLACPRKMPGFSNTPIELLPDITFNGDSGGVGDITLHAYHAEGYKSMGHKCRFYTTNPSRRALIEALGQETTENSTLAIVTGGKAGHLKYENEVDKGRTPRAKLWSSRLPFHPPVIAPTPVISEAAMLKATAVVNELKGDKPLVLLFPFAEWNPRQWPLNYWLDLAWTLNHHGVKTLALANAEREHLMKTFPYYNATLSWVEVMGVMSLSEMVVSNDSGPAHLGGVMNVDTLALVGPTTNTFGHAKSVEEVKTGLLECVGCHFDAKRGFRAGCDVACQALMLTLPEAVTTLILERLRRSPLVPADGAATINQEALGG